jgi:glucose/arabinose dehydrogenase
MIPAQIPQPQADKLPAPAPPGTPNFSQLVERPRGAELRVPPGFRVNVYADNLPGVRWMQLASNGDVFASQYVQNRVVVLRDFDRDGEADLRSVFARGPEGGGRSGGGGGRRMGRAGQLTQQAALAPTNTVAAAIPCSPPVETVGTTGIDRPMGMAFHGGFLYIANTGSIVRYRYKPGQLTAQQPEPRKLVDLPSGGFHGWRNIIFNRTETKMYVTVGSASNNRAGEDCRRAAILEFNPDGTGYRTFATGLRNPEGLAWQPGTDVLWTAVNERDNYGDDLVPDFITSVRDGGFYGWPYSYIGQNYDPLYVGGQPEMVKQAIVPDVLIPAHSAPLGITFYTGDDFPERYQNGAFVALHGSWNRSRANGYRVIFVPFRNGKPGPIEDFLTGFLVTEGGRNVDGSMAPITHWGRPVSTLVDRDGSLLLADDQGGRIWRIRYAGGRGRQR